jgi:hypothetical protein
VVLQQVCLYIYRIPSIALPGASYLAKGNTLVCSLRSSPEFLVKHVALEVQNARGQRFS